MIIENKNEVSYPTYLNKNYHFDLDLSYNNRY